MSNCKVIALTNQKAFQIELLKPCGKGYLDAL